MHAHMLAYSNMHTNMFTQSCVHSYMPRHICAYLHKCIFMDTLIYVCSHLHTLTQIQTHKWQKSQCIWEAACFPSFAPVCPPCSHVLLALITHSCGVNASSPIDWSCCPAFQPTCSFGPRPQQWGHPRWKSNQWQTKKKSSPLGPPMVHSHPMVLSTHSKAAEPECAKTNCWNIVRLWVTLWGESSRILVGLILIKEQTCWYTWGYWIPNPRVLS